MTSNHAFAALRNLSAAAHAAGFPLSADALVAITEVLVDQGVNFAPPVEAYAWHTHEGRVAAARANTEVMRYVHERKRINAIKELRLASFQATGTSIGLREAKEAVEDDRVFPLGI